MGGKFPGQRQVTERGFWFNERKRGVSELEIRERKVERSAEKESGREERRAGKESGNEERGAEKESER